MQTVAHKPSSRSKPAAKHAVSGPKARPQAPTIEQTLAFRREVGEPLAFDLSRISIHPRAGAVVQAKLTIGAPSDSFEQEADRVAERIARMPESLATPIHSRALPAVQRQCACGGTCAHCQTEAADEEHGPLQRKSAGGTGLASVPPIVHQALRSAGQPLAPATRAFFEPRLGFDFSTVRIHTDAQAGASAQAIQARAYTVGRNVVFAGGQFAPETAPGRALLAHELTHVVQQGAATPSRVHPRPAANLRPATASPTVQRACDPKAIPAATGCTAAPAPALQPSASNPFVIHFEFACDTFKAGEETRLRLIALALAGTAVLTRMKLRLDGFASDEGDRKFNEALSCARARKVQAVLDQAGVQGADVKVVSHGGTPGNRPDHRSVLITGAAVQAAPTPVPVPVPVPVPKPPEPQQQDDFDYSDMWPKWRKRDPWWKRIGRRIRQLTDIIEHGVQTGLDVLDGLNKLRDEILGRLGRLLPLLVLAGVAELPELMAEIGVLRGLLGLLDRLATSVPPKPYNDFPPGAGPGSRYEPPPDWNPDAPDRPQDKPNDKPKDKPEKKPDPEKKKPDDKKKKPGPRCYPILYLPLGKLPHFGLYQREAAAGRLVGYPTEILDDVRTSAYKRKSRQVARWIRGMKSSDGMDSAVLQRGKQMLKDDGRCSSNGECEKRVFIPNWGRNGEDQSMDVDHIRELQLSFHQSMDDFDQFSNYELLDESTNSSAGSTLDHALQNERKRLNLECPDDFDWQHVGLVFAPPVLLGGGRGPGIRWSKEDIIAGKHLNAFRPKKKKKK